MIHKIKSWAKKSISCAGMLQVVRSSASKFFGACSLIPFQKGYAVDLTWNLRPDVAEIMQGIAIALKYGATKAQFDSTVGINLYAVEEFVTTRSVTRRLTKPKTNL